MLDLTWVLGGPFAAMQLGDLGAEVIKIEPPDGGFSVLGVDERCLGLHAQAMLALSCGNVH